MWMRALTLSAFLPVVFGAIDAWCDEAKKTDLQAMQGIWKLTHLEHTGIKYDDVNGTLKVKGDVWTLTLKRGDQESSTRVKFTLDPSKEPKAFDCRILGSDGRLIPDIVIQGIYSIEGDTLKRCHSQPGEARPTMFKTMVGPPSFTLTHLKRQPPDDPSD